MGKIFFILGKSSSGKDTVYQNILEDKRLNLKNVVGYTTRPMREGEANGKEYYFVTPDKLQQLKDEGKVIEFRDYNTVHGIWSYFTVDDGQIDLSRDNYLYIGTLESFVGMKNFYGDENVVPIYIEVETGQRLYRAVCREMEQATPKYAELCRRFLADEEDFNEENLEKVGIAKRYFNDQLQECINNIVMDIKNNI